jgi:cytochrome bd-type quinol oxidase subunit 1
VVAADAVAVLRTGLVRRRIRPPALDHLRRAADPPVGVHAVGQSLYGSLAGFVGFYTVLLVVEMYLMVKFAKQGPGSLGTGRYANETAHA